jgi:hypothetical protein
MIEARHLANLANMTKAAAQKIDPASRRSGVSDARTLLYLCEFAKFV